MADLKNKQNDEYSLNNDITMQVQKLKQEL